MTVRARYSCHGARMVLTFVIFCFVPWYITACTSKKDNKIRQNTIQSPCAKSANTYARSSFNTHTTLPIRWLTTGRKAGMFAYWKRDGSKDTKPNPFFDFETVLFAFSTAQKGTLQTASQATRREEKRRFTLTLTLTPPSSSP